jgi:hypothetical protein
VRLWSVEISTALVDVDPPSMPYEAASTVLALLECGGDGTSSGPVLGSRKIARSSSSLFTRPGAAAALGLSLPGGPSRRMNPACRQPPYCSRRNRPRDLPNSIEPSAAKYCAFCGTFGSGSSGSTPSRSGTSTLRSCHIARDVVPSRQSRMPLDEGSWGRPAAAPWGCEAYCPRVRTREVLHARWRQTARPSARRAACPLSAGC